LIAGAIQGGITGASEGFGAQVPGMANAPTGDTSGKWNPATGKFETAPLTPTDVGEQIKQGAAAASADPLGDFIQQNEQQRALANTPAREAGTAAAAAGKLQPIPTVGESASALVAASWTWRKAIQQRF